LREYNITVRQEGGVVWQGSSYCTNLLAGEGELDEAPIDAFTRMIRNSNVTSEDITVLTDIIDHVKNSSRCTDQDKTTIPVKLSSFLDEIKSNVVPVSGELPPVSPK
jgi:hypothetical protein